MVAAAGMGIAGCNAQTPWPLWQAYSQRFLDDQGRVIDRSAGDRTTSEGEAYAMFFALVDNDRTRFDKLLRWTQDNLAQGDLAAHLPAWAWGKTSNGEWKALDANSAADADLWMAYTLLEAGRLWHDARYDNLGRKMAAQIASDEVVLAPGVGTTVLPGPHGFHPDPDEFILNPSYWPLPILTRLAKELPQGPWAAVVASLPALVGGENGSGYAMDWVAAGPDGIHPVAPPSPPSAGQRNLEPGGSFDAIRVYLWLGIADPSTPGERAMLDALPAMARLLKTPGAPPLEVDARETWCSRMVRSASRRRLSLTCWRKEPTRRRRCKAIACWRFATRKRVFMVRLLPTTIRILSCFLPAGVKNDSGSQTTESSVSNGSKPMLPKCLRVVTKFGRSPTISAEYGFKPV